MSGHVFTKFYLFIFKYELSIVSMTLKDRNFGTTDKPEKSETTRLLGLSVVPKL